ncbi:hypothetical protein R6V09_41185 [Streptomyces sp. W16]|uniref:hypothetical protein n=1 Tax=Streptomyces sp. W16 TaxID=3076631 RepID=UPI00295C1626|nr:hypothetical protein [Streptomyces sp. W16]MDV9176528.1 hypothetical protein [Streptomyces sp. W16]
MITSSWDRSRRIRAAAAVLTVITVTTGVLALVCGVSVPDAWWPHTGQAFAASSPRAHDDPCNLIAGPAKAYCEHSTTHATPAQHHSRATAAWRLLPAGAGPTGPVVSWRHTARQRQR